ncbi:MAG: DUF1572 family protein [Ferruginibacter sp.]
MPDDLLELLKKQFEQYKLLAEKAMAQMPDEQLSWQYDEDVNSIAIIIKHMWGNMLSRWTDFLTSDGEKEWRQRDAEFENDITTREELMSKWNEGWSCFFNALNSLKAKDLSKEVFIRNERHTVTEAILRQLAHYSYHVGQIVYIARMLNGEHWTSLSIPKAGRG